MSFSHFSLLLLITTRPMFLCKNIVSVHSQCLEEQQILLLQLRQSLKFNSSQSSKLVSWDSSTDCCSWTGVTCNKGNVIGLDLANESISGGLDNSSSLFNLHYLESLNLAENSFYDTQITSGFENLVNLVYLNLSNSAFVGQIPVGISSLIRLEILDLSSFCLRSICSLILENPNLMMLVQNLKMITELYLDGVNISAQGKEWCHALSSSLPNLSVLSMSRCYLSGPIHSSLAMLRSLSVMRLDMNNLSTSVPEFFANFSNLTSLHLSFCDLHSRFPENIFQVTTLQTLDISENQLLNGLLPVLPENSSLQTLLLSHTNFSGPLPPSISNLKLSMLKLDRCYFSGPLPNSLAKLTELVDLDLSANGFVGPIPSFSLLKKLVNLNLAHNFLNGSILSTDWEALQKLRNIELNNNSFSGCIPLALFNIPELQKIILSNNQFSGSAGKFSNMTPGLLNTLDLSSNNFEGPIPIFFFQLSSLSILSLSSNRFGGTFELSMMKNLPNLTVLELSFNNLSFDASWSDSTRFMLPQLTNLRLAHCKLREFPDFLKNQSNLIHLDLSDNLLHGETPNWIWKLKNLLYLNLSCNSLVDMGRPFLRSTSNLILLDLHSNQFQGVIPILPPAATYLDYSRNNFSSVIPNNIGDYLSFTYFFSLANNNFYGSIPESICSAPYLEVLDLSNNSLNGIIPTCLPAAIGNLGVLNLRRNKVHGTVSDTFVDNCRLTTLDLNGNQLEGKLPASLVNRKMLEILDIGNNQIYDTFPCSLHIISRLRVLVLRSNKFHGTIGCASTNSTWPVLQIIDLAGNNFTGNLPHEQFLTWKAMMANALLKLNHLQFESEQLSQLYYQNAITVTGKGREMQLVKILTIFTSIDFSCNNFHGSIQKEIGKLQVLYILNLSHNAFTGQIPPSFGNLQFLESLDLSWNNLSGVIPVQVANLHFISFLNLSFNHLVGRIPTSTQLQSLSESSFIGNEGLWGCPLKASCKDIEIPRLSPPTLIERNTNSGTEIKWELISAEIGFFVGFAIVIGSLLVWKRWRIQYNKLVDTILFQIFPQLDQRRGGNRRRFYTS